MTETRRPLSCDTFVALPPATDGACVIFGKNSDRPCAEVQEVVYYPSQDHAPGSKVQCTYIEIEQVAHTHAVILSKPAWMWGAEMGANEHGVCIGNEAVFTKLNGPDDLKERLLGMDYVRLGLERGKSAREALDIITKLLKEYGQGGPCSDTFTMMTYHNSYIICDKSEAWVLETLDKFWAAELVNSGVRNISNQLTIRTKMDLMSPNLKEYAQSQGWWSPDDGDFDFAKVYSEGFEETELKEDDRPCSRQQWGTKLMIEYSKEGNFKVQDMFSILRHENSGICMTGSFLSTGSQVSVLTSPDSATPSCHWFTATPNPKESLFKPFVFAPTASIGQNTTSPSFGDQDPRIVKPRFEKTVDRRHQLYKAHEGFRKQRMAGATKGAEIHTQMHELEKFCLDDMEEIRNKYDANSSTKVASIFKHMVELEMNFYS